LKVFELDAQERPLLATKTKDEAFLISRYEYNSKSRGIEKADA
jgi:hypothetical protein